MFLNENQLELIRVIEEAYLVIYSSETKFKGGNKSFIGTRATFSDVNNNSNKIITGRS